MQNGFNHRKIIAVISLFTAIILLLFLSCRTSKKIVEKSKVDIEKSELKINKIDSSISIQKNNILNKVDSTKWIEVSSQFDFAFNGENKDDEFEFFKTDLGYKFKGKGTATFRGSKKKGDSTKTSNNHQIINEQSNVSSNSKLEFKSNDSQIKINKKKDKFSISPTFGVLVGLIIIGLFIIYLVYRYRKSK